MGHPLLHRFRVLLGVLAVALACWKYLPGTPADRLSFQSVSRGFANPPFFITGEGSHAAPWNLRTFATRQRTDPREAPLIVSLGDDPDGYFQSSPPSAIDLAVVLTNFQRLGAKKAAIATLLAWDAPDVIGLLALEKSLGRFDSLVMAAPLSRGATPATMPPAFRKASVPATSVFGDPHTLPVVNHIPLAGIILGSDNTLAGFQTLDSEPTTKFPHLLARWEDRIVFAFPVLAVLQRLDLPVEGVEIHVGQYLKLGADGPIVPIDRFGRLPLKLKKINPYAEIPAEALIDGGDDLFPPQAPEPVILRDDRSNSEPATRKFSKTLPSRIAALASDTGLAPARDFFRLAPERELILLGLLALALAVVARFRPFPRRLCLLLLAGLTLAVQFIGASTSHWLPGLPALAAIATTALIAGIPFPEPKPRPKKPKKPKKAKTPKPRAPISTPPAETPAEAPAPKAPPAAKKPPSKKAAPKRRRGKGRKRKR